MDIEKELAEALKKQKDIVGRLQQLDQERQLLLQEALRIDGEIRALTRLNKKDE